MDVSNRMIIGPPTEDVVELSRRIMEIEGLLASLSPQDVTLDTPQGPLQMTILGREVGLGDDTGTGTDDLMPVLREDGANLKLSVTGGFVGAIRPDIGGGQVGDDPAEELTVNNGDKLWLVVTLEPNVESADDAHWMIPGGNVTAAEFVVATTKPAETEPSVSLGGAVTNGVWAVLWAEVEDDALAAARKGTRVATFCPPRTLKLALG